MPISESMAQIVWITKEQTIITISDPPVCWDCSKQHEDEKWQNLNSTTQYSQPSQPSNEMISTINRFFMLVLQLFSLSLAMNERRMGFSLFRLFARASHTPKYMRAYSIQRDVELKLGLGLLLKFSRFFNISNSTSPIYMCARICLLCGVIFGEIIFRARTTLYF